MIGKEQMDLDVVLVAEHKIRYLQHGSNSRSTGDHDKLIALLCDLWSSNGFDPVVSTIAEVLHVSLWSLNVDRVADFEGIQVLAQLSSIWELGVNSSPVNLNDKGNFSEGSVVAHGSVGSHDLGLLAGFRVGFEIPKRNVLSGWKAENGIRSWESKDKFSGVVRQDSLSNEREWLEVVHWQDGLLSLHQEEESQDEGHGRNNESKYIVVSNHDFGSRGVHSSVRNQLKSVNYASALLGL